ncbi:DUF6417 family protein [Streptomyces macrosporus]|uniref:Uncharacterized protein n=1 Tax=Streptomyces macrosporus TaxID=44032 RepID=A0ABN3JTF7_9ACTN
MSDLQAAPAAAGTLWEALIEAHYHPDTNRWRLQLDDAGLTGLAHAAHLEALTGSVAVRNRLHRAYDLTHPHPHLRRSLRRRRGGPGARPPNRARGENRPIGGGRRGRVGILKDPYPGVAPGRLDRWPGGCGPSRQGRRGTSACFGQQP